MKAKLLPLAIMAALGTSMSAPLLAQEKALVIEGYLDEGTYFDFVGFDESNLGDAARFRATFIYDPSFMTYVMDEGEAEFNNQGLQTVEEMRFEFFDAMGAPIMGPGLPIVLNPDQQNAYDEYVDFDFLQMIGGGRGEIDTDYDIETCGQFECTYLWTDFDIWSAGEFEQGEGAGMPLPVHNDTGSALEPITYMGTANHYAEFFMEEYSDNGEFEMGPERAIEMWGAVADTVYHDACPFSNEQETVTFGEYDTGVENYTDATGCTVMDHYQMCWEQQQSSSSFLSYSGPSYCERQVAYTLYGDGVIDYNEVRALRNYLTMFYRSGGWMWGPI